MKNCAMSVQRRKCKLCDGYTVVYVGKNGARGRNRTTDTRIFNVGGVIYTFINSGLRVNIFGVRVSVFLVSF